MSTLLDNLAPTPRTPAPAPRRKRRPALLLTARDVAILRDLFDSRILTARQLADIHFHGSRNAAKQRLWALKRAGHLAARFGSGAGEQQPLRLTRKGFEHLRAHGHLADYPRVTWLTMSKRLKVSDLTLGHELDVGALKAAFHRVVRGLGSVSITTAVTWPRLLRFSARPSHTTEPVRVSPDGFVRLAQQVEPGMLRQLDFFLEVDRSTETLARIVERTAAYVAHYTTGGYAKRQGGNDPRAFPYRVLWTFRTQSRLDHFLRACREHARPILKMAWATTHARAIADPFAAIWRRPVDDPDTLHTLLNPTPTDNRPCDTSPTTSA